MAENQVYLIKSGQNSFVEETEAIVGISGGKVGIGTTAPEADLHVTGSVKIGGDLAVDGTFTTINSSTISVDDKNIELGSTDSPTDITADGGGITVKGTTDKTFNWIDATDAWTSSEHLHLAAGKSFAADAIRALGANGLNIGDDAGNGIFVQDGGKVGIATTNPGYDLDVDGSGNFASLYVDGNAVLTGEGSIFGKWEDGAAQGEIFYTGGNVGVGTNNPEYPLHVVGNSVVDGNFVVNGTSGNFNVSDFNVSGDSIVLNYGGGALTSNRGGITVKDSSFANKTFEYVEGSDYWNSNVGLNITNGGINVASVSAVDANGLTLGDDAGNGIFVEDGGQVGIGTTAPGYSLDVVGNGNFSQGLYVNGNSVLTGSAADLGKWDEGANSKIFYSAGNVGVGTSDPSVKFEVVGDSLFNGNLSVGSAFSVSTNGSVGGILPTSAGQVVGWDGSSWRPITSAGGGGSSSEVPEGFVQSLASGQSEYTINFTQTYDSAPAISTDLQIDGAGDIIPYAISEVTTSGYSISFAKDLPNDNYKIHTNFGGRDVFWTTGALGSINYSGGDVSVQDSLSVGANLTVQGNAVLTGSAADLGKWDEGAGSEIYYSDGNVGVGTSNPSYTLHVNGTIYNENGELNVANKFNVSSLGAVGGQSPAFNEVIKWDGSKWIAGSAPGGGDASSSEVPSAFDTWLTQGSSVQAITFVDAPEGGYQSIPSISTDVEIVDGDIIPYAISGVSTTGYYAVFSDPIPTANNYKIHTTFGGKEVYWKTGAGGSSIYYDGDSVSVDDLVVGGNLTVNGTTTTVNTETVEIEDHNLVIAANTGYNQLTSEYPGAGGAYAGILWGTGDAGAASPVSLTYQTNKGFAFEGGNVGIGTTSPAKKLHIHEGTASTAAQIHFTNASTGGTNNDGATLMLQSSNLLFRNRETDGAIGFQMQDGSIEALRIAANGNVGIGTSTVDSALHIKKTTPRVTLQIAENSGYNTIESGAGNQLIFGRSGTEQMRIDSNGNVGIGTTNPGVKLSINLPADLGIPDLGIVGGSIIDTISGARGLVAGHASGGDYFLQVQRIDNTPTAYDLLLQPNGGNVGIGTTNPSAKLHIEVPYTDSADIRSGQGRPGAVLRLTHDAEWHTAYESGGSDPDFLGGIEFESTDSNAGTGVRTAIKTTVDSSLNSNSLVFYTAPESTPGIVERMRIDSAGNVGIGTTSPLYSLDVYGFNKTIGITSTHADGTRITHASLETDASGYGSVNLFNNVGNPVVRIKSNADSYFNGGNVGIGTANPDNSDWNANAKILHIHKNDTHGGMVKCSSTESSLIFSAGSIGYIGTITNHDLGLYTNAERKMTIKAGGNVGIGTTNPNRKLCIESEALVVPFEAYRKTDISTGYLMNLDSSVGGTKVTKFRVEADGDVISATNSYTSDERAKTEISDLNYGVDTINQLQPKQFKMLNSEEKGFKYGFVAQEIETVLPDLVREDGVDDGEGGSYKALEYNSIIAVLTKAIQEQQQIIEDLKSQNASLAAQNADFESRISQLEQ